ncbi:hypothetical protein [Shewanella dokdonensis]|uniref:Uncharacterized protein n=1 Tax=Shewanella dokdonensis TaxID=712036 RepID=A0ABX8DJF2_9GAMM|nr:hypothetical protein [Shewanella dokdonensis]MCL1074441.1 hypothetical protein [Shewanella dokdonensis]QVK24111.1 hypothetical protein KHX94_05820 [Shewanella dokdonensis]
MKKAVLIVAALLAIAWLLTGLFVWREARNEVVFLCGNFTPGVSKTSVLKQLATGEFLRLSAQHMTNGSRIVADSPYTLGHYRCVIEFDANDKVRRAGLE